MRPLLALLLSVGAAAVHAGGTDALRAYLRDTQSGKARFAQVVVDKNLKQLSQATGTMQFQRPGRFRWEYAKPYEQSIIGDGTRVWIYDKDLNQVTMRKLDRALGSTPAALLAGNNEIEKAYMLSDIGQQEGLDWVEAVPRSKDTTFESIRMGFGKDGLEAMELNDAFGQKTLIKFGIIERNPKLPADLFRFTPPKGADVISE
jgi:chaperone LolA